MVRWNDLYATVEGVNPPPTCLLCEMKIPATYDGIAGSPRNDRAPEHRLLKDQWSGYWKSSLKHVMVPSIQIEKACFADLPRLWSCFCRAIIKESDTEYRLTGIGYIRQRGNDAYHLPKDPTIARIGGTKNAKYNNQTFTKFYAAKMSKQPTQYKGKLLGFIIHAHCWVLFHQALGARPTDINLAKFIKSSRNHWRKEKLQGLEDCNVGYVEPNQSLSELEFGCDIYQNPVVIPALQEVITRANTGDSIYPHFSKLPLEVIILISEWVCPTDYDLDDVENIRNMLFAFQWNLPDWFWRRRLQEDLFFELDILWKSSSPVNWQMLGLGLMGLVSDRTWYTTRGLANRERILRNVLAIGRSLGMS